jgi:hypothetical protein
MRQLFHRRKENKKQTKTRRYKYIVGIFIVFILVTIILVWVTRHQNPNIDLNDPNLLTLSMGTQLRFEGLDVGLSGIQDGSAILAFHQEGTSDSSRRTVLIGDKFMIYGYIVEIKAIEKAFNLSSLIGASHGDVKLLIKK